MTNTWTPENEAAWQHVNRQYDFCRSLGLDILKYLLSTSIAIAAVPIVFFDKLETFFGAHFINTICISWYLILVALIFGFISYFFTFFGYYNSAHFEADRFFGDKTPKYHMRSTRWFNAALYLGCFTILFFVLSISFVIYAIMCR